jgi:hypothetical protein
MQQLRLQRLAAVVVSIALCGATGAGAGRSPSRDQRDTVVVEVHDGGFHWGDAAIGGAAVCALGLVAGGAAVLRPTHRKGASDA